MSMKLVSIAAGCLLCSAAAYAQEQSVAVSLGLFVYPSGNQAAEQQTKDEQECYAWSKNTTGIDPKNPPASQRPATAPQVDTASAAGSTAVKSAARNVLIANATDNDWEEAAAIGLVFGGARGANNARRRNEQAQREATAKQQQQSDQQVQQFKNAFSACIEGRGYTIR